MTTKWTVRLHPARRALTALELIFALAITALIGLCVMAIAGASSQIWRQQQDSTTQLLSAARARTFIERVLRHAQDVGYCSDGTGTEPAAILLWRNDALASADVPANDHRRQKAELMLIRYDADQKMVKLFHPRALTQMTAAEQAEASATVSDSGFNSKEAADAFAAASWVQEHTLAGASAGQDVMSAWWHVDRSRARPLVDFRLQLAGPTGSHEISGTVSLRVPNQDDDWSVQLLESDGG